MRPRSKRRWRSRYERACMLFNEMDAWERVAAMMEIERGIVPGLCYAVGCVARYTPSLRSRMEERLARHMDAMGAYGNVFAFPVTLEYNKVRAMCATVMACECEEEAMQC